MICCPECEVEFEVIWQNNGWTTGIYYCPFCGREWETTDDLSEV